MVNRPLDIFLQTWGGGCYLLNKILLSRAEGREDNANLRIWGWGFYLIGLPAWVIILVLKHNWIAATIEAGGAPAMLLGLIVSLKGIEKIPKLLDKFSGIFAFVLLAFGVLYSLYDYNGITSVAQLFEIGVTAGFLGGTYLLAKKNHLGWLLFMLMNISMGLLMLIQNKPILAVQQFISLCFVLNGFYRSYKTADDKSIYHG